MLPGELSFYKTQQKQANKQSPKARVHATSQSPDEVCLTPRATFRLPGLRKEQFLQLELAGDGKAMTTMWSLLCSEPDPAEAGWPSVGWAAGGREIDLDKLQCLLPTVRAQDTWWAVLWERCSIEVHFSDFSSMARAHGQILWGVLRDSQHWLPEAKLWAKADKKKLFEHFFLQRYFFYFWDLLTFVLCVVYVCAHVCAVTSEIRIGCWIL